MTEKVLKLSVGLCCDGTLLTNHPIETYFDNMIYHVNLDHVWKQWGLGPEIIMMERRRLKIEMKI